MIISLQTIAVSKLKLSPKIKLLRRVEFKEMITWILKRMSQEQIITIVTWIILLIQWMSSNHDNLNYMSSSSVLMQSSSLPPLQSIPNVVEVHSFVQWLPQTIGGQIMVYQYVFITTTNNRGSNKNQKDDNKRAKSKQNNLKSYEQLKDEIKEFCKDVFTLTFIVCKMDETINKQALELF